MTLAEPTGSEPIPVPRLSPFARMGRIFTRPAAAWVGLEDHSQWWFPMLLAVGLWVVLQFLAYDQVTVPMMLDSWQDAVASGRMDPAAMDRMSRFFTDNPAARWIVVGQQAIFFPIITLLSALVAWFGTGFVLGTKFRYRHALEVMTWSGLVKLPSLLILFALAWQRQTFKGVHLGLGVLLPEADVPSKLQLGLTVLLDSIGPFEAWQVVVAVIGAAALSGAPRRSVAWVLVALYLALAAFLAAVAALFSPGA